VMMLYSKQRHHVVIDEYNVSDDDATIIIT